MSEGPRPGDRGTIQPAGCVICQCGVKYFPIVKLYGLSNDLAASDRDKGFLHSRRRPGQAADVSYKSFQMRNED